MLVISIHSQVVHGHVGNSAAVFPMQAAGIEVAAIPTTLLSNHPHYPTMRGRVLDAELVGDLLQGVEERGLVERAAVLVTGYLGSPAIAGTVHRFVLRALKRNPALIYVCDPVMGDSDLGVFVADGMLEDFRDQLVPLAGVITPNQFELGLLTGKPMIVEADLLAAGAIIPARIVATGCVFPDTPAGQLETVLCEARSVTRIATPRLPIRPCGTGDLMTALLAANLARGAALETALSSAVRGTFAVLERTRDAGDHELRLLPAMSLRSGKQVQHGHERS